MKRLLLLGVLAATLFAGLAQPARAEGLRKREHRVERRLAHRERVWNRKHRTWARNHPNPRPQNLRNLARWERHFNRKEGKLLRKEQRLDERIERRHDRHH